MFILLIFYIEQCFNFLNNYQNKIFYKDFNIIYFQEFGEYQFLGKKNCLISIKLWGAGGGSIGGYGGYSNGTLLIEKDQKYILIVGEEGKTTNNLGLNYSFGGGGLIGKSMNSQVSIGTGGGLTGLFLNEFIQNNSLIIAGGGGGGSFYDLNIPGGNGGGLNGSDGSILRDINREGKGGTQFYGGFKGVNGLVGDYGSTSGGALFGGNGASTISTSNSGCSGGGGYFGGGGGGSGNYAGGPGGGGSGYINLNYIINGYTNFFEFDNENFNNFGYPNQSGLVIIKFLNNNSNKKNSNFLIYKLFINFLFFYFPIFFFFFFFFFFSTQCPKPIKIQRMIPIIGF